MAIGRGSIRNIPSLDLQPHDCQNLIAVASPRRDQTKNFLSNFIAVGSTEFKRRRREHDLSVDILHPREGFWIIDGHATHLLRYNAYKPGN
jgi:hypothetical protein